MIKIERRSILYTLVLLMIAFFVIYPLMVIVITSLQVGNFGQETHWGFGNWIEVFSSKNTFQALVTTFQLASIRQLIGMVVGIGLAWLIARTDLPGKRWIELFIWITFFLPLLTMTLGWILLLDDFAGLANRLVEYLPFVDKGPFNIYSKAGIVWVHLATSTISLWVMILTPVFRNIDSTLEEASFASGASSIRTFFRITLPIMMPAITVTFILGMIRSLESFEVELILGLPKRIDVYSTIIFQQVNMEPPGYGISSVMSLSILILLAPLIIFQTRIDRKNQSVITGKAKFRVLPLGKLKWPSFALVALLICIVSIIPTTLIILNSFLKLFGNFSIPNPWTLDHWREVLGNNKFLEALRNTFVIAGSAALLSVFLYTFVAYITIKTKYRFRGTLNFLTWLPSAIPGIILGLGFLVMFLKTPIFQPLYGTIGILVIAVTLATITFGVQLFKSSLAMISVELEEASWASGASWWFTMRKIIFPLIFPMAIVVGIITFSTAANMTSHVVLLSTPSNKPLSVLLLDELYVGSYENANVFGVVIMCITLCVAFIARFFGMRNEIGVGSTLQDK